MSESDAARRPVANQRVPLGIHDQEWDEQLAFAALFQTCVMLNLDEESDKPLKSQS